MEERVLVDGSVTVLQGPPLCGKTRIIAETARRLRERGEGEVFVLDEWDVYAKTRAKLAQAAEKAAAGGPVQPAVWFIDDIDDKMFAGSEFSVSMAESDSFPRGAIVMGVQPASASEETLEFLNKLRNQRKGRCETIALVGAETRLKEYVESVLEHLDSVSEADRSAEGEPIDLVLDRLSAEERQLLEFLAVARFSLPVDVVLSVFPESERGIPYAAHRLVSLGMIAQYYRQAPPKGAHTIFFALRSGGASGSCTNAPLPPGGRRFTAPSPSLPRSPATFPRVFSSFTR